MSDERDRLLRRLIVLERQAERFNQELRALKQELLEKAGEPHAPADGAESPPLQQVQAPKAPAAKPARPRRRVDLEFWLGGRGLLLLGVAALVLAVGFFVKEAIERGWIGPVVRVLMGVGVGAVAVIVGERIRAASYRTYGLWLAAGGFSAGYLSLWAAVVLYSLISTSLGFTVMFAVVVSAAAYGLLRDSESFVGLAAVGGYLAPLLLQVDAGSNLFKLGYIGLLTGAGLLVAQRARWVYLATVAIVLGALMPLASPGDPHLHGVYIVALVAAALLLARSQRWLFVALLGVVMGWFTLLLGRHGWQIAGIVLAAYAAALWLANLIASLGVSDWRPASASAQRAAASKTPGGAPPRPGGERHFDDLASFAVLFVPPVVFFAFAITGIAESSYAELREEIGFGVALFLGAAYLVQAARAEAGMDARSRFWRTALGFGFWILAPRVLWAEVALARAWLLEGIAFAGAGVLLRHTEARAAGLTVLTFAAVTYWGSTALRPHADPAFYSLWALTGLAISVGPAAWSLVSGKLEARRSWEKDMGPVLLLASAVMFLGWGTVEITHFYDLLSDDVGWDLARDLSISAFWLAYAAVLLGVGFRLARAPVRWAGLGMALIAAAKVFLYDLSQLSQLYRIGSFILLAIVLLALSFRYQRFGRGEEIER